MPGTLNLFSYFPGPILPSDWTRPLFKLDCKPAKTAFRGCVSCRFVPFVHLGLRNEWSSGTVDVHWLLYR